MKIVSRQPDHVVRPRLAALSTLPVFYTLAGKRVLLAGGLEAAAWKAELLAATGAVVEVVAPDDELSEEMVGLGESGQVRLIPGHWSAIAWDGYALAVGDCEDENEAAHFAAAARRAGVPVNVIDKPAFCDFQFGTVVNRSPLVVGISTTGAAPILGQTVRQRIEALLPPGLSAWAGLAQRIREEATNRLQPGAERRQFWQRLADKAFSGRADEAEAFRWIEDAKGAQAGRVTLVGAGPGDAEYLTIKALRALQSADVILFDDLVSDEVLELARREAKRILVGKRGGRESCRQEDINAMLISLAKAGRHVVRLKSGDPMIFGRAGEEIAELDREGIRVDVVPGITTALALASELKMSLTHRDCAQSVRFVTGHARNGKLPGNLDWRSLADAATTHIYYMAGRTAAELAGRLLEAGMPASTPVVVASDVGRATRQVRHLALGQLVGFEIGLDRPVIIGIGEALRQAERATEELRRAG